MVPVFNNRIGGVMCKHTKVFIINRVVVKESLRKYDSFLKVSTDVHLIFVTKAVKSIVMLLRFSKLVINSQEISCCVRIS